MSICCGRRRNKGSLSTLPWQRKMIGDVCGNDNELAPITSPEIGGNAHSEL